MSTSDFWHSFGAAAGVFTLRKSKKYLTIFREKPLVFLEKCIFFVIFPLDR